MTTSSTTETLIDGRYRLLRELQRSEGSTLWEAQDDQALTIVHLRLLDSNLRDEPLVAMRFRREYELAHRLEHPALIRPRALVDGPDLALVYEHPGKETLAERLRREGALSPAEITTIINPVLQGLHLAHRQGVVHRNISPEQIWLDQKGHARLGGFGAARVLDMVRLTTQSVAFGISPFTAPELLMGGEGDHSADLWSVGQILLRALLGPDVADLSKRTPQELLGPLADEAIGRAICAALIKIPQERVQSALELHDLLSGSETAHLPKVPSESAPCWSCQRPRMMGLKYCHHCGAGPLIRQPGLGTRSVVIPRQALVKPGILPWVGSLFFRRYKAQLSAKEQAQLLDRLRMAGFELSHNDSARAVDLPLRVASKLTPDDAARLTAFLQRQQVLDDDELEKLNYRRIPAYQEGGDLPMLYQHEAGARFALWEQQTWSARGNRFGSPLLFSFLLLQGWSFVLCVGLMGTLELFDWTIPLPSLLLVTSITLSFPLVLTVLRVENLRPLVKETGLELLSQEEARRWAELIDQLSPPDQRLLQELFHKGLHHIRSAPPGNDQRRRLHQVQALLGDMRDEFQTLIPGPDGESWSALQARVERARRLKPGEGVEKLARAQIARFMQRQERTRSRRALARARIHELIRLLDADPADQDGPIGSVPALEIGPAMDELRALHQSFLEVEDRPRFDDLKPARDQLSLPIELPERFDVLRRLASGGQAQILAAQDHLRQESVVLKVLHEHRLRDEDAAEALRREFAALKALNHPNVVAAHELLELDDGPVLVLELCPGVDLKTMISVGGALPPPEVQTIAMSALAGLSAIHRQGLIHGDIKPANLMIDEKNQVKIIDLGLSQKLHSPGPTKLQGGTPAYAAPEVQAQSPLDASSDLYSLALTLAEAFHGELPTEIKPDELPQTPLWKGLTSCLSPEIAHRPPNAQVLYDALRAGADSPALRRRPKVTEPLCHGCQYPSIPGLTSCLECGAQAQRLRSARGLGARQVVLLSNRRGRLFFPQLTLSEDQLIDIYDALEGFTELELPESPPLTLQKTPAILTPPLHRESARLVRDELRSRGLRAYSTPAHIGPRLLHLTRRGRSFARQIVPLLALLPILVAQLFRLSEEGFHPRSLLITLALGILWLFLLLRRAPEPAATLNISEREAALTSGPASWASRFGEVYRSSGSARTKALLRELAIESSAMWRSLAHEAAAEPVLAQLDQTVEAALSQAQELIQAEETVLDLGESDQAIEAYQVITEKSAQILEVIQELRAH